MRITAKKNDPFILFCGLQFFYSILNLYVFSPSMFCWKVVRFCLWKWIWALGHLCI